jgi:salicylate hydroxylase
MSIYKDFPPAARRLFELADPNGFRIWKLQDMDDIPHWSLNHTVLLGDAAHPVLPFGFAGASMAIEDAVTLSILLPTEVTTGMISARLKIYEEIRKPRVERVRTTSRESADEKVVVGQYFDEYMQFLASYDAVEHAEKALLKQPVDTSK